MDVNAKFSFIRTIAINSIQLFLTHLHLRMATMEKNWNLKKGTKAVFKFGRDIFHVLQPIMRWKIEQKWLLRRLGVHFSHHKLQNQIPYCEVGVFFPFKFFFSLSVRYNFLLTRLFLFPFIRWFRVLCSLGISFTGLCLAFFFRATFRRQIVAVFIRCRMVCFQMFPLRLTRFILTIVFPRFWVQIFFVFCSCVLFASVLFWRRVSYIGVWITEFQICKIFIFAAGIDLFCRRTCAGQGSSDSRAQLRIFWGIYYGLLIKDEHCQHCH